MSETATIAAGCFWGVEEAFRTTHGVISTVVGYTGGRTKDPTYSQVCTGRTGHAEAVRIEFDPEIVEYEQLLEIFWRIHDPTQINRQGPDVGTQYRSAIFYHDDQQKREAARSKAALQESGRFRVPVATEIVPAPEFYEAEEYHQKYIQRTGMASCHNVRM